MAKSREKRPQAASVVSKERSVVDTGVIWCGDNLEKLKHLPAGSVDLIYIDPPFNSNRKRAFEDRHTSTKA